MKTQPYKINFYNKAWTIIFCAECHEPFPPGQLENYNGHYLCETCDEPETLSQPCEL